MLGKILLSALAIYVMASVGIPGFFPSLIIILLFTSGVYALQFACPPLNKAISFLALAQDSSLVPPYDFRDSCKEQNKRRSLAGNNESDNKAEIVHFCFLVHGYKGHYGDLSYFETVLKHRASVERSRLGQDPYETDDDFVLVPTNSNNKDTSSPRIQEMIVHNVVCNSGKTHDGIINGGDRLVEEITMTIESKMNEMYPTPESYQNESSIKNTAPQKLHNITVSVIGNSMGGLYGRYAIAKLIERHCVAGKTRATKDTLILNNKYRLHLDTFCTTASPHLGVSQHTWLPVPRIVELGVAATMGQTGSDLFRLNDLLYTMCTDSTFLDPLASFRKRIAYANCYGTDFPVPVKTAAFLSDKSTYPHQIESNFKVEKECGLVIATLTTKANEEVSDTEESSSDDVYQMSVSLDKLGWKKVFVDLQKEMMSISLPNLGSRGGDSSSGPNRRLQEWKKLKTEVTSQDMANAVTGFFENDGDELVTLRAPVGHNMIVGLSRDRFSSLMNKGGRPLVDALSKELIRDIFVTHSRREEEKKK